MGRPSKYSQEISDEICDRLSKGEPLAWICREDKFPSVQTVGNWKNSNETFSIAYGRARDEGFDALAADCLNIADENGNDTRFTEGGETPNSEWITRSRVRIETRLKLLSKWDPKRYGEKVELEHSGNLEVTVTIGGNAKSER